MDGIVQKLVSILSFKISGQNVIQKYDALIVKSQKQYEKGWLKANEKVLLSEAKVNNVRQTLATKLAGQKAIIEAKVAEKVAISGNRIVLSEQLTGNRLLQIAGKTARAKIKISESSDAAQWRSFKKYGDMAEREMNRRLAAQKRAAQKAKTDMDKDIHGLGMVAGMASMGLGGVIKKSGSTYGDYEAHNIRVQAKTGATDAQMKSSQEQDYDLNRKTMFDAIEISALKEELAGKNYTLPQAKAITPHVLDVASITKTEPVDSARIMAQTLHQFNLGPIEKNYKKVADLIGISVGKMGLEATQLETTMKYAGAVANLGGVKPEDAVAISTAMALRGLAGSTPGTGFRSALLKIGGGKKDEALKNAGVDPKHIYDKQGNVDLIGLATIMQKQSHKFTKRENLHNLFEVFGAPGAAFGGSLMASTEKDQPGQKTVMDLKKQMSSTSASKIAEEINKGYNFDMKQLSSSMLLLNKVLGEQLAPKLERMAKFLQNIYDWTTKLNPGILNLIGDFILAGFAVTSLTAGFIGLKFIFTQLAPLKTFFIWIGNGIKTAALAMWGFNWAALAVPAAIVAIAAGIAILAYDIYQLCTGGKIAFLGLAEWINKKLKQVFGIDMDAIFDTAYGKWAEWIEKIEQAFSGLGTYIENILGKVGLISVTPQINIPAGLGTVLKPTGPTKVEIKNHIDVSGLYKNTQFSKSMSVNSGDNVKHAFRNVAAGKH